MDVLGMTLRAEGLKKSFGARVVVDIESLEVAAGRTLAILGPSGAGKSTLLSILGLLEKPDAGTIYLDGRPVHFRDKSARMHMAAAFQSPYLFRGTIADNVAYGLKLRRVPSRKRREDISNALARVGLEGWEDRGVHTLSGGEAQRVALARAMVLRPSVLFLDEPLASLDPLAKGALASDFSRIIREDSMTTVYVTHDQNEAVSIADQLIVMRDGRSVAQGETYEVMGLPPDEWTAEFLGAGEPLEGEVVESGDDLLGIDIGGQKIWAVGTFSKGERVLVGVRPEDVLLFEGEADIPRSTARNRLDARIVDVRMWGVMHHIVLRTDGGLIASRVSHFSVRDMGLAPGAFVQAVFKATAVRVRLAPGNGSSRSSERGSFSDVTTMGAGD